MEKYWNEIKDKLKAKFGSSWRWNILLIILLYIIPGGAATYLYFNHKLKMLILGNTNQINNYIAAIIVYFIIVSLVITFPFFKKGKLSDLIDKYLQSLAIFFTVLTLYSTNNYNLTVQREKDRDEKWNQAKKEVAWVSDTRNIEKKGIIFENLNNSNLPLYDAYFFLVKNDNEVRQGLQDAQVRRYVVLAPAKSKGSFAYDKVNEGNKYQWKLAYIFKDVNGEYWQRKTNGELNNISRREYNDILRDAKIDKSLDYTGESNPGKI